MKNGSSNGGRFEKMTQVIFPGLLLVYICDMSVFYIMVPASIFLALIFLGAFLWSVKSGQYEDTYTPSVRILFDDGTQKDKNSSEKKSIEKDNSPSV